ncbi:Tellurite resistance protein TerB [Pelagimonas phthalicica]|uniref:Tellurite resistance protein TerB n=1 Tax=Pelagimonas phthalicica TaxID=1037362 RepID=A0A238JD64_9RHOB|nr:MULTISPECIES: TerB family tellurite resistance protein [Roseobacteraceae]MBO9465029.1 TerB family tellurite resistance protein [Tropicibacter sp. R15_0]TDS93701.1 putative tellurite resistance protein B-like protein [Pelagimonas phthalicica]SMX27776.1 Tellurite resistance protein TerB [Pelagimonas phthalicica]
MLEQLTQFFQRKHAPEAPLPKPDAKLALGTLLVRVAMADKAYLFEEIEQIDRILAKAYDLNPIEAAKMRATCEKLAFSVENDEDMAALIRDSVDYDHRREKVEALWQVVLADGITDEREAALVDLIEKVLGVDADHSEAARLAASIP